MQSWPKADADIERRKRVENYLDAGYGCCLMKDERIADLVQNALLHFENERYALHAWCVMPNHVHALITPLPNFSVGSITQSWKSFIAHEANKLLKRRGPFWQPDVYDRFIRNEQHFQNAVKYIENNPVKAGLCESPNNWTWSSANRP